ncbi:alpha-L-glutamate ligase [Streptomyces bambusae]|uniref:ATP-grasp domain-containing protein n=1 Tax=Streptomyces bambusae TaxID=1550616 RepID=UPI001CFC7E40|nr:alpha-L-glutamate ligase [Streptomyces bambusae]MCB5165817.1 alpha-L-glutamate ligase [Streptomyces bambusae]
MILFFGRTDDPPLARAVGAARDAGLRHLVVDQAHLARYDLVTGTGGLDGLLVVDGMRVPLDTVAAVYARPLEPPAGGDAAARARVAAFQEWFVGWLDTAPAFVVSRPSAMESNSSKPYQAQLIARAGFPVPDTLVTDDPGEVLAFRDRHGRIVYKSVSGIRSIVREFTPADEARLPLLRGLPTQFQAYVPGRDVRVHVVGGRTYAASVDSDAVDYRYAGRDGDAARLAPFDLPPDTARHCVELAAALGLPLAGIDLRRTPDGAWVCFEVNPMPAYSYYEAHTGLPIAAALVSLLAGDRTPAGASEAAGAWV